ncbi:PREDICTED: ATP-dependent helicase rhp16-like isoform X2 [Tarenaya hassleriana]|uniref:ATP-dependent helicase rhp16-like isoform X2 n=1 Tax=Tarenaya hassleriana TaxID=28532 RepID=UPI00053C2D1F|nr:PREDICTED: ATP-dependent helicase rhp16-like isoform X2 [Tarenaya hassleriana]
MSPPRMWYKGGPWPRPSARDDSSEEDLEFDQDDEIKSSSSSDDDRAISATAGEAEVVPANVRRRKKTRKRTDLAWQKWEKENMGGIDEHLSDDVNLDEHSETLAETAEQPPDVIVPLLKYQKEWLAWAMNQEASVGGGILADEMGMGKTLQAISLALSTPKQGRALRYNRKPILSTLVVCPKVAVSHWKSEIDHCTSPGSTKVIVYYGKDRRMNIRELTNYDFVITTYSTVLHESRGVQKSFGDECPNCGRSIRKNIELHLSYCKSKAPSSEQGKEPDKTNAMVRNSRKKAKQTEGEVGVHSIFWNRIILDEAHCMRDKRSKTARAVFALEAKYRWALSGTPLQNCIGELYAMIRFLQIRPYSYHWCNHCDCSILDLSSWKQCPNCSHEAWKHFCWWNKVELRRDSLDVKEADYYESLCKDSQAKFDTYVQAGTVYNNYVNIFELLVRLRQAVNHPYLVVVPNSAVRNVALTRDNANDQGCCICDQLAEDRAVARCGHVFCMGCVLDFPGFERNTPCPACSKLTTPARKNNQKSAVPGFKASSIINKINLDNFQSSTKIEALKEEIRIMVERDGSAKAIVFSQFVSFLDLINYALRESGVSCVQIDGTRTMAERDAAISKFKEDKSCRIILMSLKVGGVALNLMVASHVFIMDPSWNPAAERQAQDRIHRIGQHKPTRIVRFIIENTVEERILELQKTKEVLIDGMLGAGAIEAVHRLTLADLRSLFL